MKSLLKTTIVTLLLLMSHTIFATVLVGNAPTPTATTEIQLTNFTVKDYQKMMGRKLSLREKIVFHYAKSDLLKQTKTADRASLGKAVAATDSSFNLGGFLLGFVFSIVGVLVAGLFGKNVLHSAWRGFLFSLLLFGLAIIYYFAKGDK
jgi:hypothetical protein